MIGIHGHQHIKSWLDFLALHFSFIRLPLANLWTLGLKKFDMSVLLHLWLPPERRILDGDLDYILAIGLLVKHNLSPQHLVALLIFPGLTNDNFILISLFGYVGPN